MKKEEEYILLIKTDKYTGNFERKLCAYCTGVIGDCGVGEREADDFIAKHGDMNSIEELVLQKADEHACWRPVSVSSEDTNALEIYFDCSLSDETFELIKLRAKEYGELHEIKIINFVLFKQTTTIEQVKIK